jgi:hypothetical protein
MSTAVMNGITLKSAPMPRLRLTKRGRRVLVFLVAFPLAAAALAFALNGGMAAATNVTGASSLQYVTVESGQSLWQLASEIAPSADPRDVISDVVHLNQLTGTDIQAGQRLAIPARYSH